MFGWYLLAGGLLQGAPADTITFTAADAVRRAVAVSPYVDAAQAAIRAPRGVRAELWSPLAGNPTLEVGGARRRSNLLDARDRDWAVTQEIAWAPWFARRRSADLSVRAAEARRDDAVRLVALDARRAFVTLFIAERRAALADSAAEFAERLAAFAHKQFAAGETNRLELNAAALEAARARGNAERALAAHQAAAARLGALLALPPDSAVRTGGVGIPAAVALSDSLLLRLALDRRPDLRASLAEQNAMASREVATKLSLLPSLAVGVTGGREGGTDALRGLQLGLRVPLVHQEQAARGEAAAAKGAATAAATALQREIIAELRTANAQFARSADVHRRYVRDILPAASQNVTLTERALTEGEVGLTEVLVLRSSAVTAQLEYLEVLQEVLDAWAALATAAGVEPGELERLARKGS